MARPRKLWSYTHGQHGAKVRIQERSLGGILRFDYRDESGRHRPEVIPHIRVRATPDGQVDKDMERVAKAACEKRQKELAALVQARKDTEPDYLTVGAAYRLFNDPKHAALPPSDQARKHHADSRAFWEAEFGLDKAWDAIMPAVSEGALKRLIAAGHVATADKRFANLRQLYRWLREKAGYDALRNPLRGVDMAKLRGPYTPHRPRYAGDEPGKMVEAAAKFGERFELFVTLVFGAGARGGQVRLARRSGLNCPLEPPPPPSFGPHGWLVLPGVKGQAALPVPLTRRERAAIDRALAGYLAEWEAEYQANGTDYPLIPGGRSDRELIREPMSDRALRYTWADMEKAAGVPTLSRRAFHGARRSWVDRMRRKIGTDATAHAGGWSDTDMVDHVYGSAHDYEILERAREAREAEG